MIAVPIAALVVGIVLGSAIERTIIRNLYGRDEVLIVLATFKGSFSCSKTSS